MSIDITYSDFDRKIWEQELNGFVPQQVFDAHCHIWREKDAGNNTDKESQLRLEVDGQRMLQWNKTIFPGRKLNFYYLATPLLGIDVQGHNEFMLYESRRHQMPAAALVTPGMTAAQIAELFDHGFSGLKPYRIFADDPNRCDIVDYLPEEHMEVAEQYHGKITLHLSKQDGILDPKNQKDLEKFSKKYPHVQWILAHCARAFNCYMVEEAIHWMSGLGPNVWYDMSAVCDTYAHYLLMKHLDRTHLMFGTDNIGCGSVHGKYITWGRAWAFNSGKACFHCNGSATIVVYEQLRAMKHAADMAELTDSEVKDIFYGNARRLFDSIISV